VLNWVGGSVTPVDTVAGDALAPIPVGSYPVAIAMSARTSTAYVANFGSDTVTPISLETNTARPAIPAGFAPDSVAVTPDGQHLVVSDGDSDQARVIDLSGGSARTVGVGYSPDAVAVSGSQAYAPGTPTRRSRSETSPSRSPSRADQAAGATEAARTPYAVCVRHIEDDGRIAQRKSVRLTSEKSQVRTLVRPLFLNTCLLARTSIALEGG
jgi:DNA-binding beta-propeller fold protein YncE